MIINLRDPASIARWLAVWPSRHWAMLTVLAAGNSEWRAAALLAREIVRSRDVSAVPLP